MWHEARRQERKIRGMLVDYRRRAERRRDFYEKIKADPTQFLQLHGRPCKIHLDSAIATAADSPATMMPWQGQSDNLIDRFDVRAHLDFIPPVVNRETDDESYEERQCNYERYRILAQNNFLSINEEKFLKQLHLEEQFGYTAENDKERKRKQGAAIGFNYDEPGKDIMKSEKDTSDSDDTDSDLDVDLCIDVSKIEQSQAHEMNRCGQQFGMCSNDFYSFLINDMEEAENIRIAREEEHEKALYSGRKSRRERRAHRERRLANRIPSPPSYAARASPTYPAFRESKSNSKSPSPVNTGQITYITSFGGDEDPAPSTSKPSYADKVKFGKEKKNVERDRKPKRLDRKYRSLSRGRSRSPHRYRHKRSRSNDRSRSRSPHRYRYRRSNSRSNDRKSHSCSPRYRHRKSRSRTNDRKSSSRSPHRHRRHKRSHSRNRRRYTRSRSRSRSRRNYHSPSTSSSSTFSSSSSSSRSKSRSKSVASNSSKELVKRPESPKPVQRYYGRKQEDKSSSDLEDSSEEEVKPPASSPALNDKMTVFGNSGSTSKMSSSTMKMTPQERLKRKMQILLNKQYKADKIAEQIRTERAQQEQRNREDELREMALKLRRKQRERRHAYDDNNSRSSESDSSDSSKPAEGRENRKRSLTPSSPRRTRIKDDDKYKEEEKSRRDREKSPKRQRTEDRPKNEDRHRSYRDKESPSVEYDRKRDRHEERKYDEKKREETRSKHRSLVDY